MAINRYTCETCRATNVPVRFFRNTESFETVSLQSFAELVQCPECHALWAWVAYEPYATVHGGALWPYDAQTYDALYQWDGGSAVGIWTDAMIALYWQEMPAKSRDFVSWWRERTYRNYNPIDQARRVDKRELEARVRNLEKTVFKMLQDQER